MTLSFTSVTAGKWDVRLMDEGECIVKSQKISASEKLSIDYDDLPRLPGGSRGVSATRVSRPREQPIVEKHRLCGAFFVFKVWRLALACAFQYLAVNLQGLLSTGLPSVVSGACQAALDFLLAFVALL